MTRIRIGSLFSGFGGLDIAVQAVLGGEIAFHVENEPAAQRLLAHHHPDAPNLGDITQIDWTQVHRDAEWFFILTGGFPCTDVSTAGRREGLRPGTRSGLWAHMAYAIAELRPDLVVIENVRGLLTARGAPATDELIAAEEQRDRCAAALAYLDRAAARAAAAGNVERGHRVEAARVRCARRYRRAVADVRRADRRIVRAIGTVLGDLADLGYDARWVGLRAADEGAPHPRFRIFILAWPARDADGGDLHGWPTAGLEGQTRPAARPAADAGGGELQRRRVGGVLAGPQGPGEGEGPERERDRHPARDGGEDASDTDDVGQEGRRPARDRRGGPAHHDLTAADADHLGSQDGNGGQPGGATAVGRSVADTASVGRGEGRTEPAGELRRPDAAERGADAAADPKGGGRPDEPGHRGSEVEQPLTGTGSGDRAGSPAAGVHELGGPASVLAWGPYEPAIRRWELILGRPAPAPTMTSTRGGQQLSPPFVEWMMGLPEGHVTAVPGLSRAEQLKMLGNGVVPQQAAAALTWLLAPAEAEVAA